MTLFNSLVDRAIDALTVIKERRTTDSHLKVYDTTEELSFVPFYNGIQQIAKSSDDIPIRGSFEYSMWLDEIWKVEPILSGAVYSMVAKMQSMNFIIEGGRNNSKRISELLARARYMGGEDWAGFIGSSAIDFYTQDNGVWWDVMRQGGRWGRISDLSFIDTRCCVPTGNTRKPMYYRSDLIDDDRWYKPWEFIHYTSMSLPNEKELGMGYCAVSRAARAAKLLMALHSYDAEKLSNLPPEGIASVTGMTAKEFQAAVALWIAARKRNNMLTFPQVLWLVGNNPSAKISVDIASFSNIPESFDRQTVVSQYVNTLALCFGVDAREFWAMSSGALGTASEAEVQHLKARGKGGGEFITLVERHLNAEFPDDVIFKFDTQDIEEDMIAAEVAEKWIQAYIPLLYPPNPEYDPVLDVKTFKRMLADNGVLPEWVVGDDRVALSSYEIHKDEVEQLIRVIWDAGKLIQRSLPAYITVSPTVKDDTADFAYEIDSVEVVSDAIRGKPISDTEAERGSRITKSAVDAELSLWSTIPELEVYVPSVKVA